MTTPFIHDSAELQSQPGRTVELSPEAQTFNWLLDSFTSGTAGVQEAVAVSSDGLLMAMSATRDRANAERLAGVGEATQAGRVRGDPSLPGRAATRAGRPPGTPGTARGAGRPGTATVRADLRPGPRQRH